MEGCKKKKKERKKKEKKAFAPAASTLRTQGAGYRAAPGNFTRGSSECRGDSSCAIP
ncbi:hypothetical protein ACU4GD_35395 [Cupriavidus basilensis]